MTQRHIQTPIMHRVVEGQGQIYLGGTCADDESLDMAGQARDIFAKIDSYLAQAGSDKTKLLQVTIFVTDLNLKPQMDAVWKEWIPADCFPARATVGVNDLGGTALLEVTGIASK